jgi:4-coumarate--CoA ligase (photoactive yellow protein activation family)
MLSRMVIHRMACAIVAAEIRRLRGPGLAGLPPGDWPESMRLDDSGLGVDSLEQLGALGALAEIFCLDGASLPVDPPQTVGDWIDWIERGHALAPDQIVVMTSGSTGTPRACIHATADLLIEAGYLAGLFPDRRRIVAMVPAHHLYGIVWTALLPAALAIPVAVRSVGAAFDLQSGDLVVAVPEQWASILRLCRRMPQDLYGVSSAGSLPDTLANDLLTAGLARLVDVYGSSETGAIALRQFPASDYALLPRWEFAEDDEDWLLRDTKARRVPLPDRVERTGPRSLRPVGRRDSAVQVAGHNVWPERVAMQLNQCDGVDQIAVRLGVNGRLKAFVVPVPGAEPSQVGATLQQFAASRLSEAERPKSFCFGNALPRNEMGKLTDWP